MQKRFKWVQGIGHGMQNTHYRLTLRKVKYDEAKMRFGCNNFFKPSLGEFHYFGYDYYVVTKIDTFTIEPELLGRLIVSRLGWDVYAYSDHEMSVVAFDGYSYKPLLDGTKYIDSGPEGVSSAESFLYREGDSVFIGRHLGEGCGSEREQFAL